MSNMKKIFDQQVAQLLVGAENVFSPSFHYINNDNLWYQKNNNKVSDDKIAQQDDQEQLAYE